MTDEMTAQQAEAAEVETVIVRWRDLDLVFPATLDDCDGDVLDAIDDQKSSHALKGLLGDQWPKFKAARPRVRDYNEVFEAFARAAGLVSVGESGASST